MKLGSTEFACWLQSSQHTAKQYYTKAEQYYAKISLNFVSHIELIAFEHVTTNHEAFADLVKAPFLKVKIGL